MFFRTSGKIALFLSVFIGVLVTHCWAESERYRVKVEYDYYNYIQKFGEYKPQVERKFVYRYYEGGKRVERDLYSSPDSNLHSKATFEYDENGRLIEEVYYKLDGGVSWKGTYEYDERGNEIESFTYGADGKLRERTSYEYDDNGDMSQETTYLPEVDSTVTIFYEKNADWTYEELYSREGEGSSILYRINICEYDEQGNEIAVSGYKPDGTIWTKTINRYDKYGNRIEYIHFVVSGDASYIQEETKECQYDIDGKILSYTTYERKFVFGELQKVPVCKVVYQYEPY